MKVLAQGRGSLARPETLEFDISSWKGEINGEQWEPPVAKKHSAPVT